jgi:hypothetical protein
LSAQRPHAGLTVFDFLPRRMLVHHDDLSAVGATVLQFHSELPPITKTIIPDALTLERVPG